MRRPLWSALILVAITVAVTASLFSPPAAEAARWQVKFFVTEYRLKWVGPDDTRAKALPLTLELRGKASLHGGDKVDFRWEVEDATPYLPLLNACGTGRLHGAVALVEQGSDRVIEGRGPLAELGCRMILK